MGVKNLVKRIGDRAGNRVAKLSELSSGQVERVQEEREKYLLEMPDPNDRNAREITEKMMAASSIEIFNAYLSQIKDLYIPVEKDAEYGEEFDPRHNIRYFKITKWVTDTKENNLEKLVNVYAVLADEDCNIALVFNRKKAGTDVYLAVVNTNNDTNNVNADIYKSRLIEAIKGNFPGAGYKDADENKGIIPFLDNDKPYTVAAASNIPTEKSEKFISQTIEKLLDGIVPESKRTEYTLVLLATPIKDVEERKLKLGEFYSGLKPYESWQTSFQFDDMQSFGSSATVGVNVGVSAGIQNGQNSTITDTEGTTDSSSRTDTQSGSQTDTAGTSAAESESNAHSDGTNESTTNTDGTNWSEANGSTSTSGTSSTEGTSSSDSLGGGVTVGSSQTAGVTVGNAFAGSVNASVSTNQSVSANYNHTWGHNSSETVSNSLAKSLTKTEGGSSSVAKALGKTASDTLTKGLTNTVSNSIAKTTGNSVANTLGKAVTKSMAKASGVTKAVNYGANMGANFARSSTVTAIVGKHEGITQSFANFNIKHALELLEAQMKRLEQSTALGMWDFAAYVLSEDQNIANNVAHTYLALTLGEESYMSKSAVNLWRGSVEEEKGQARTICSYIRELRHPIFALSPDAVAEDAQYNVYPPIVTATTSLSGKELAYSLNFPQKAVAGLPILECAEFGRNVVSYDITEEPEETIRLGNVFHMNHEESNPIRLSLDSFRSHAFITGSTGSGKSNTVYHLLDEAMEKGVHFLVVEPAKGEYKNVFGNDSNVSVYGTNPLVAPLLRIDPFSFPNDVHVLEHMDRLVEIFNVCWPMYAAMPAVLKSAVEKSYVDCGWDLITSKNKYDRNLYPDFKTVADNIRIIIDSSEYDNENKGAYKGSLLTRLQSLTNGINGLIFASDELSGEELFDRNVIIDLSRVGSSETKSLIMGLLVLKLQEYRSTSGLPMNSELKHITVLEEAHNLLRRTSTQQSTEGANLLGKSVEMIANAIAEMRTYGEGFIIADQAPGLMDMSVIRNTNTKIIMRLPDQSDRELVGKAANLNDDQIKELAKLPCGVAAVYQNEWVQPVLCKIEKVETTNAEYKFDPTSNDRLLNQNNDVKNSLLHCIMDKELFSIGDRQDLKELKDIVLKSGLSSLVKADLFNYIESEKEDGMLALQRLIYDFLDAEKAISESVDHNEIHEWVNAVLDKLEPSVKGYTKKQIDIAVMLIIYEQALRDSSYKSILNMFIETYRNGGGVF